MSKITLDEFELEEIRKLARDERQALGFVGETPIANDIFTIIENLNIKLLEYPIESEGEKPAFSAALMYSEEGGEELVFIGLNTADHFDKQVFALAHELYHFYTKTGSHLSRLEDEENNLVEAKANRFAAEFLLPESVLESIVLTEFKKSSLQEVQTKTLLRFIARLQCTWWLPYRSLVKRLKEIEAISDSQYTQLYAVNERNLEGEYGRLGQAINREIFLKLNAITSNIGLSPKDIEVIIRNFEDNIIDEDKFSDTLHLFHKTPDEFGYEFTITDEDMDEFDDFFKEESDNES
ncbi:ImmA/IrrE family metallo-endopeptidase [Desertibacillus haloalkaliphilus]|uniref:ImmA/IrrE family metallo-endopeptidase n=1 Tax=Desertibacillus haloalkaliphilus TaxID=1328930 RepID=UPI001C2631DD|nr:ImmA/IrrE family metallo-endopeptidase [Desertibacillus haloalkaliphilus]MBU8906539.1 ImmA/IrrE family metallo-endopeptidase [Desertibacillus haloalkaliphilus]